MRSKITNNTQYYKKMFMFCWGALVLAASFEMCFFPSAGNLIGCFMAMGVLLVFQIVLFRFVNWNYPFSFFAFSCLFSYRFFPLFVTLLEGKPISYGMDNPERTFAGELLTFVIAANAFILASIRFSYGGGRRRKNTLVQELLFKMGFYKATSKGVVFILGILGLLARVQTLSMGSIIYFGAAAKFLNAFNDFVYAPVLLFFPCLLEDEYTEPVNFKKIWVWGYLSLISILIIGTNSRSAIIAPFATIALLYVTCILKGYIKIHDDIKIKSWIKYLFILFLLMKLLDSVSNAMLLTRNIRGEVNFEKLIQLSLTSIIDTNEKGEISIKSIDDEPTYSDGWTEVYSKNFILNRFVNIRITDEVLYFADKIDNENRQELQSDFWNRVLTVYPQPILDLFRISLEKKQYENSRGDFLYYKSGIGNFYSLGGYRVTSSFGDGYSTFGFWYFPMQLVLWFIVFKLINWMTYITLEGKYIISSFALMNCYSYFTLMCNSNGMVADLTFCLRTYWQDAFIYLIAMKIAVWGASSFKKLR